MHAPEFQSLLYWIGYSNAVGGVYNQLKGFCFNPCCIGLGIQTAEMVAVAYCASWVSILVVLDWVFKLELNTVQKPKNNWFQSLLYWIGYSNAAAEAAAAH